jgi:AcrR family transcriptional regulator
MQKSKADNRTRLLEAALKVTYQRGFAGAALSDIAKEARVPLGNVYYYFQSKDQIGDAIVERRVSRLRSLLQEFNRTESRKERLCAFVENKIKNRDDLARRGCPAGTLCSELHKSGGAVARRSTQLFREALAWMEEQFEALGQGRDSRGLAVHLLSATQGVSVLAHAFHDPKMIEMEAERLKEWIRSLQPLNGREREG